MELVDSSKISILTTMDTNGYPNMRAMLSLEHDGLKIFWFSTNKSSEKVRQIENNSKAGVYFCDEKKFMGLRLMGEIRIRTDKEARQKLWRDGFEMYYPKGVDDPDYCVLEFSTKKGRYYHGLNNIDLEIE